MVKRRGARREWVRTGGRSWLWFEGVWMVMWSLTKPRSIVCSGVQFWEQTCWWEYWVCSAAFCVECSFA